MSNGHQPRPHIRHPTLISKMSTDAASSSSSTAAAAPTCPSHKVPIIKLSSLRPSAQLLIILFLFLQFFALPTYFSGNYLRQVCASPASGNLQSPPNYRRTSLPNINRSAQLSSTPTSNKAPSAWRSQSSRQRHHQSATILSNVASLSSPILAPTEQLIASESKSTLVSASLRNAYNEDAVENKTASLPGASNFQCPEQFGYFVDSTDCSRYYVCVFGDPLHETCTGGLYFSSELQTCDWPQNVICNSNPRSLDNLGENSEKNARKGDHSSAPSSTEASVDEYGSNDLDQPAFDESIASFIDQNGDVYVHDGPGGLYSLIERTAAISDHDKPDIMFRPPMSSVPAAVNSIEKKTQTDKPPKPASINRKKYKPKCAKNCTINQNVQFDDEIEEAFSTQQQHHHPEHLRPRPNIVKKQLKDYDLEFGNKVDELDDEDGDEQKVNNSTNTGKQPELPITFVATKDDMWNADRSTSKQYSSGPKSSLSYNKYRRSEKDASTPSPMLSEDSILQVFRGQHLNHRNYLLQSFNTLPLPFPTNLVKPWKSVSYASSSKETKNSKANATQSAPAMSAKSNTSSTANSKPPGTEIHIFYSYRNPHQGSKKVATTSTNLPTVTVLRPKEAQRNPKQSEIFTMRSSDLLMNKNTTSSPPLTTVSPVTASPTVNLHLDYRYTGNGKATSVPRSGNASARTATTTSTPASVFHFQPGLYSNYSYYDMFEMLTRSTMSTTTASPPAAKTPSTTTLPSVARHIELTEEEEKVSPKHNFISYSAPSESSRPKSIPSICDPSLNCKLPRCFCPGTKAPYGFKRAETPQMILLTFDDAVNDVNFPLYEEIFEKISKRKRKRTNPNGCPIRGTFFVSHEWTDYAKVQTLFARGHEIASHSITHRYGEKYSTAQWRREMVGQREILHRYAGIPREAIRGMRAPFLQIGGDQQFQMLMDSNMTYDSSISIFENSPPFWPYTLDFAFDMQHDCMISPCPSQSYPGLWEIGLVMWQDDLMGGGRCTMGSSCNSPANEQGVFELIMSNFKRHYEANRAPFGLFYQSGWFTTAHHKAGFLRFIDEVLLLGDVFFVTNQQALQWMQQPTRLIDIEHFKPWQCTEKSSRTNECFLPNICHVKFRKKNSVGSRYFKTCQTCPVDYPWIDNIDQLLD